MIAAMMDTTSLIFLLLRCGLGAMFAAAATAKARDLAATRASAVALGVPERVAPAAALALVATEAAVAVSLVITPSVPPLRWRCWAPSASLSPPTCGPDADRRAIVSDSALRHRSVGRR